MSAEIKIPAVGESVSEATIAEWTKNDGDYVHRDDVLIILETDKASVEVVAENDGVLAQKAQEGDTVEVGTVVGEIDTDAEPPADSEKNQAPTEESKPSAEREESTSKEDAGPEVAQELKEHLAPAAQRIVDEAGLDPTKIKGTGRGGRITKEDAQKAADQQDEQKPSKPSSESSEKASASAPKSELPPLPTRSKTSEEEEIERVPMTTLRKRIAERLVEAQQSAAILTTFNEVDMSQLMALRSQYKDQFKEKYGVSLGFMGFFVKAAIEALKTFPRVNASIEGSDVLYKNFYNIGIAVSTDKGLVVPVIRRADKLSVAEIEQSIRHYAIKARDGKITMDDLSGGSFTISNGGVFGSLLSTPILNPPQSGILGMHKIEERPVAINGQVEIRPMMYLALSYDHRIIDGRESVSFLVRLKECIEDPSRILLEI